ncbi:MAG: bifunctional riboflavin kinase/FAD synthetase [Coxiellaceae bacterium]|nr:bifunctional riboflavin kinase/FAD synthetase [Coxiellaceae bacterium]
MQLIRDVSQALEKSVVTIGNFDGLHKGHQRLIEALLTAATQLNVPSVLLTFQPNPSELFTPQNPTARLMRFQEKWKALEAYNIDYYYAARFNHAFADLSAEDFVKNILVAQLQAKKIIVGDDFRFGAKRRGDIALLRLLGKKYGFEVEALTQSLFEHERISSTRIRDALKRGDFQMVSELMGKPFSLTGRVAYGNQIGRTLGFPTANIHLRRLQVPLMGIFVVRVHGLSTMPLPGVASIGYRPTFNGKAIVLEVFLFNFNQTIYGQKISVEFLQKIRDELKFESIDALIVQMQQDVVIAQAYFRLAPNLRVMK